MDGKYCENWAGSTETADYDCNNCEGLARIVESKINSSTGLYLHTAITNSGDFANEITSRGYLHSENDHWVKLEKIQSIFKALFTIDVHVSMPEVVAT